MVDILVLNVLMGIPIAKKTTVIPMVERTTGHPIVKRNMAIHTAILSSIHLSINQLFLQRQTKRAIRQRY